MKKEGKEESKGSRLLHILPILVCLALVICFLASGNDLTVESILNYTPENPVLAACVLLLLYALKSMSLVFPIAILQISAGVLFSRPIALLVNFIGRLITLVIPYGIGAFSGSSMVDRLLEKYPSLAKIISQQKGSPFFISLFLRFLYILPGDAVSMYLGAIRTPFPAYLAGGILGTAPSVITSTLLGDSISDPTSPAFILAVLLMASLAVGSVIIQRQYNKKHPPLP